MTLSQIKEGLQKYVCHRTSSCLWEALSWAQTWVAEESAVVLLEVWKWLLLPWQQVEDWDTRSGRATQWNGVGCIPCNCEVTTPRQQDREFSQLSRWTKHTGFISYSQWHPATWAATYLGTALDWSCQNSGSGEVLEETLTGYQKNMILGNLLAQDPGDFVPCIEKLCSPFRICPIHFRRFWRILTSCFSVTVSFKSSFLPGFNLIGELRVIT